MLKSNIYDVICLVETFLTNVDTDYLLLFENTNYNIFRNDRNSHSGGVAIICISNLNPIKLYLNDFNNIEQITLVLHSIKNKYYLEFIVHHQLILTLINRFVIFYFHYLLQFHLLSL